MPKKISVSIFGAGSLGQAMIYLAGINHHNVHVYDPDKTKIKSTINHPKIRRLSNITFHSKLDPILFSSKVIIPCIPSCHISKFYNLLKKNYHNNKILSVSKGFFPKSHQTISQKISPIISPNNFITLSGPNFSGEIVNHSPTKSLIASHNPKNFSLIKNILATNFFQVNTSNQVLPTELAGIYKNCYSITLGIIDQLTHSMNSKALTIVKITEEINPLFIKFKAPDFTHSISFLGDLIATGLNPNSRNYRCGFFMKKSKNITTEGLDNLKSAIAFAKQYKINLPLLQITDKIIKHHEKPTKIFALL